MDNQESRCEKHERGLAETLLQAALTIRRSTKMINRQVRTMETLSLKRKYGEMIPSVRGPRLEQVLLVRDYLDGNPEATIKSAAKATFYKRYGGYPNYRSLSAYCYTVQGLFNLRDRVSVHDETAPIV